VVQRERVLLFDIGVRNALLGIHRRRISPDQLGSVFEQWVILQVVYLERARRKGWRLSSYRSEHGAEVDLVVERDHDVVGIEVKAGRTVSPRDTRGLRSLAEVVGRGKRFHRWILYRGETRQRFDDGTRVFPVLDGLSALADG
jgi:predicted AAA+ superfamily ATPase